MPATEADSAVAELGVKYQLVTDHTSMLVLGDETFARQGVERRNQQRVATEVNAQAARATTPQVVSHRVDSAQHPFTPAAAPSHGGNRGGGAFSPWGAIALMTFAWLAMAVTGRHTMTIPEP